MNKRSFLSLLGATLGALVVSPWRMGSVVVGAQAPVVLGACRATLVDCGRIIVDDPVPEIVELDPNLTHWDGVPLQREGKWVRRLCDEHGDA
jgi:hypothetical protein